MSAASRGRDGEVRLPGRRQKALSTIAVAVVAAVLLGSAAGVQALRERAYPLASAESDDVLVTSGTALRRLTPSLNTLAADLYWIRAIQYYGGAKRRLAADPLHPAPPPAIAYTPEYDQLFTLLDITTTLDPRFDIAYRFGAVFLAEAYPAGAGRPDLAVKLLEKGLREQPDKWEYMEDIGFVYYWFVHDYRQAAAWFDRASTLPGAPNWLKPLAATTLVQGGDRQSSRLMWKSMLESGEVDWLRSTAEHRLLQLDVLDALDQLQPLVDQFARQTGQVPTDWRALIRAGVVRGIPLDPTRHPYGLGSNGRVELSPESPLNPLPIEPERLLGHPPS